MYHTQQYLSDPSIPKRSYLLEKKKSLVLVRCVLACLFLISSCAGSPVQWFCFRDEVSILKILWSVLPKYRVGHPESYLFFLSKNKCRGWKDPQNNDLILEKSSVTLILQILLVIMKINNVQGDLTDALMKTKTLATCRISRIQLRATLDAGV